MNKITNYTIRNKRKIFYFYDNFTMPVMACGVLIFKYIENKVYFLMINHNNSYEDFGGKTDFTDNSIEDVASREAYEESNALLNKESIKERLKYSKKIYITQSKYLLYLVNATHYESNLKPEQFGEKEIHDNIYRTVEWVSYENFLNSNIHIRLRNKYLFDNLEKLKNKNTKLLMQQQIF